MKFTMRSLVLAPVVLAGLILLGGCGRSIWIAQHPDFYTPELKTVAVMPFDSRAVRPSAGAVVADRVAEVLRRDRTYAVIAGKDLSDLLEASGIKVFLGDDPRTVARKLAATEKVQAVMVGKVLNLVTDSRPVTIVDPAAADSKPPGGSDDEGEFRTRLTTRNSARVAADVFFVGVGKHASLFAATRGVDASFSVLTDKSNLSTEECLWKAYDLLGRKLAARFAYVPKQIEVPRYGVVRAAKKTSRGDLWPVGSFQPGEEIHVLVRLPDKCADNRFRIEVARDEDGSPALASHGFGWQEGLGTYSHSFGLKDLAPGEYEVRLYCIGRLAVTSDFSIKKKPSFNLFGRPPAGGTKQRPEQPAENGPDK